VTPVRLWDGWSTLAEWQEPGAVVWRRSLRTRLIGASQNAMAGFSAHQAPTCVHP